MLSIRKVTGLLVALCLPAVVLAATANELQMAATDGNVAFVLVTEQGAVGTDQAKQTIQSAMTQIPGSVMIESHRADAANTEFVQKYGLASAPVPLILVFAPNGVIAGGNVASELNPQQLVAMVPSPKKAEALKAIQSGQAVYVTASRSGMSAKPDITKGCAAACAQMQGKCVAIDVDMDDPAEVAFLTQLKVNMQSTEPVTIVLNSKGQLTETYTGAVEIDNLIASAKKVVSSGCCPSGSGTSCSPTSKKAGGK